MKLGEQLRQARKQAGFTQSALAQKSVLSIPTIRFLERGQGNLSSWTRSLESLKFLLVGKNLPEAESLGGQVALLRKRRALSQRTLAQLVKVTQPTIVRLERYSLGRLDVLERCLEVLGAGASIHPAGAKPSFYTHAANTSGHTNWHTPKWISKSLRKVFGVFDLDPCSPTDKRRSAPVSAKILYTESDNGLELPWHGKVFMNPPYGRTIGQWTSKARNEFESGNAKLVVGLIPARTDTRWWHEDVAGCSDIFFLRGRLSFGDGSQSAPFPSAIAVWGASRSHLNKLNKALPATWQRSVTSSNFVSL